MPKKLTTEQLYDKYDNLYEFHDRQRYIATEPELARYHKVLSDVYYKITLELRENDLIDKFHLLH